MFQGWHKLSFDISQKQFHSVHDAKSHHERINQTLSPIGLPRCVCCKFLCFYVCRCQEEMLSSKSLPQLCFTDGIRQICGCLSSNPIRINLSKLGNRTMSHTAKDQVNIRNLIHDLTRNYRKRCIGRLRKQVGDFHLLTGLPGAALDVYSSAIDYLR